MPGLFDRVGRLFGFSPAGSDPQCRQASRRQLGLPVDLSFSGRQLQARTCDISMCGAFIAVKEPPAVGTKLTFVIDIEGHVVRGVADTVWIRRIDSPLGPAGIGCEFRQIERGRDALRRLLA